MYHGVDISGIAIAIAGICSALSGANSYEATKTGRVVDGNSNQSGMPQVPTQTQITVQTGLAQTAPAQTMPVHKVDNPG
jgi:hypothetical protein